MENNIEAIIVDLGGVIINLDVNLTFDELAQMSHLQTTKGDILNEIHQLNFAFERGEWTESFFFEQLKIKLKIEAPIPQIKSAWNRMLLDIPKERVNRLLELRKKYKLYLLSNTNETHLRGVLAALKQSTGMESFDRVFDHCFYSQELGMRKPNVEIYQHVLETIQTNPAQTLFMDDNYENIAGAESLGIKTIYICPPLDLMAATQPYVERLS